MFFLCREHNHILPTGSRRASHALTLTQTARPHARRKKKKLTAIGVVGHSDNAHRLLRDVGAQHLHVSSRVFVSSKHGPPNPVGPEDVVAVHSQAERMHWLVLQHHLREPSTVSRHTHTHTRQSNISNRTPVEVMSTSLTYRRVPSYSQRSILSRVASEK